MTNKVDKDWFNVYIDANWDDEAREHFRNMTDSDIVEYLDNVTWPDEEPAEERASFCGGYLTYSYAEAVAMAKSLGKDGEKLLNAIEGAWEERRIRLGL